MVLHILYISGWGMVAHQCSASASWWLACSLGLEEEWSEEESTWHCSDDGSCKLWFAVLWMVLCLFSTFMLAFWPDLIATGACSCTYCLEWFACSFTPMLRNILCRALVAEHQDIWARCFLTQLLQCNTKCSCFVLTAAALTNVLIHSLTVGLGALNPWCLIWRFHTVKMRAMVWLFILNFLKKYFYLLQTKEHIPPV